MRSRPCPGGHLAQILAACALEEGRNTPVLAVALLLLLRLRLRGGAARLGEQRRDGLERLSHGIGHCS